MLMQPIDQIAALILSLGAIGAGLSALNLNLLSILKLNALSLVLKYTCGVAGLFGAYKFITGYQCLQAESSSVGVAIALILIITNIGVGLSGLGTNLARALHVEFLQKSLQLTAGVAGTYSLFVVLRLMNQ
jgi:hypothetical protein